MLKTLLAARPAAAERILGVTERDLFIPMPRFVFGQAQMDGPTAVISLARLSQEFYGLPETGRSSCSARARKRSTRSGHTFGLVHCAGRGLPHVPVDEHRPGGPQGRGVLRLVRGARQGKDPGGAATGREDTMRATWRILVIDDEAVMRESLAAWLREDGYEVDTAASGREADRQGAARPTTRSTSST